MSNTCLQFRSVATDRLFYDRYLYSMSFCLPESAALRAKSRQGVSEILNHRREWRHSMIQCWGQPTSLFEISEDMENHLLQMYDFLESIDQDHKLVVELNHARIYTNDMAALTAADHLNFLTHKEFSQATISRPRDTVILKNPQYQYRMYFRTQQITTDQRNTLRKFLLSRQDQIRLSPALTEFINNDWGNTCLWSHHFIDHNDPGFELMLSLVQSGVRRKTLAIIPADK